MLVILFAILLAGNARAEDVEAIVKRGVELRRHGEDQAALAEFKRALAIKETPRVFAQVGFAEQALGLWIPAEEHLLTALKDSRDAWVVRNRGVLDTALGSISNHLGTVEIWGEPAGAEVIVNGQSAGKLPTTGAVRVVAGACSLVVRAEGYDEGTRTLQVGTTGLVRENVQLVRSALPRARPQVTAAAPEPAPDAVVAIGTQPTPEPPEQHVGVTRKWWFWTAIGVAVAGGAAAAFVLTRPRDGLGCPHGVECP